MLQELKTLTRHSAIYGTAEILKKGLGFLMIPVYTHFLLPADYGLLELLEMTVIITGIIFGLRLGGTMIRFYHQFDDPGQKSEVVSTTFISVSVISLLLLVFLQVYSVQISSLISGTPENAKAFRLMFLSLVIQNIYLVGENYLLARKKSAIYSSLSILTLAISLTLNILFVVGFGWGVYGILYSMLIAKLVNLIIVVPLTFKDVSISFSWIKLRDMLYYGLPLVPASIGMFLMHFSDRFFIRHYVDLSELGIYALAYKFGMILSVLVAGPIFKIWNTQRFEIARQEKPDSVFGRMFTYFLLAVTSFALILCVFIDEAIHIMAAQAYQSAASLVPILVLAYLMISISGFFNLGCMITGRTKILAGVQVVVTVLNIFLNILLISRYGIMGAAVSTLATFSVLAVLNYHYSQKVYYISMEHGRVIKVFFTGLCVYVLSQLVDSTFWIQLGYKGLVLTLFPLILWLTGFFSSDEKKKLKGLVRNLKSKEIHARADDARQ
ncbi:oligosaccharide flippase family protein [Desulfonatronovibrio hydrogenovorans]|uniref:oligosaccharide flippase family protein n=1 Tax=Desulfonatronovibrio hydrogenovorans TaxID=53245 RepID=UPI0004904EB8|nr:oligosaccharide flippase family protein [Desulfonatronovibrio hydrogenovorans]